MTELESLQEISSQLTALSQQQHELLLKVNTIDFYIGVLVGVILGLIFWNVAKGVSQ